MRDITVEVKAKIELNNVPDSFSSDDIDCLVADIVTEDEEAVNNGWAAEGLMWEYKEVNPVVILKDVPVPETKEVKETKEKNFCAYCGLDLREVYWAEIEDEDHCPSCGEKI